MKNSLNDLSAYLFEQLDRLSNDDLTGEELEQEIERSKAINAVGRTIVDNAATVLRAAEFNAEYGRGQNLLPNLIESKGSNG